MLHFLQQSIYFCFRHSRGADVLNHQSGEGAVVILGQYLRQLFVFRNTPIFIYFFLIIYLQIYEIRKEKSRVELIILQKFGVKLLSLQD